MNKELLTTKFFEDNPVKELTAQLFIFAQLQSPMLKEFASDYVRKFDHGAE